MGTIVNVIAVVIGGFIGLLLKNKISRRFMEHITVVLGCAVIIMGIVELIPTMIHFEDGKLTSSNSMILILSLVIGYGAGHWLGLSRLINKFSDYLERKVHREGFAKGFVSASLLFCVGAMTFSGAILDGLGHPETLYIKSVMDFLSSIILGAALGYGVIFSSITVLVYQGTIFLLAGLLNGVIPPDLLEMIEMVGYAIVIILGLNLAKITKIETVNLIPAILIPIEYYLIMLLF